MKRILLVLLLTISGAISSSRADSAFVFLNAGDLIDQNAAAITSGSLILLMAAGTDGSFYDFLNAGQFTSGDDVLLGAAAVNNNNGSSLTSTGNTFNFENATAGQAVAIRWFSNFTLTQYLAGETPGVGSYYGTFAGVTTGATNKGSAWVVPNVGSSVNLNFGTVSANASLGLGLTDAYANSFGQTTYQISAVPEPSQCALIISGLLGLLIFVRQRNQARS